MSRILKRIIVIVVIVAIFGSTALFFALSGKITSEIKDGRLYMSASYIGKDTIATSFTNELSVYKVELVENFDDFGQKIDAIALPRIQAGRYKSKGLEKYNQSGEYTLYRHKGNKSVIILYDNYSVYVVNDKSQSKTRELFQKLLLETNSD